MNVTLRMKKNAGGSVRWYADIRDENGKTIEFRRASVMEGAPRNFDRLEDRVEAEAWVEAIRGDLKGKTRRAVAAVETVSKWWERYHAYAEKGRVGRKNKGRPQASIEDRRSLFKNWIAPILGDLPMCVLQSEHVRKVVMMLDEQIRLRAAFYRGEAARDDKTGRRPGLSPRQPPTSMES